MKDPLKNIMKGIEERFNFNPASLLERFRTFIRSSVPQRYYWYNSFGVIILILFLILIITGILLSFYYKPTPEDAYVSVKYIMNQLPYGWLIRSIHYWASYLLVCFLFAHFWRVYFTRAYSKPRELLYLSGLINMFLFFLFVFTGGLLVWDNQSYWATSIMTSEIKDIPVIGNYLRLLIRGGFDVGSGTLTRFFVAHIVLLPFIVCVIVALHLAMIYFQGLSGNRTLKPLYPNAVLLIDITIILFAIFTVLIVLSVFVPAPLLEMADPLRKPESIKPSWFMLPVFKFYKAIPAKVLFISRIEIFIFLLIALTAVLVSLPFFDSWMEKKPITRFLHIVIGVVVLTILIFLTFSGLKS